MKLVFKIIFDYLVSFYREIKSYFVVEKIEYKIEGECNKCGECCRYMYSFDTYSEKEFRFMQFIFPAYKRFYIRGKDEYGNLIFACKYVQDNGLCSVYDKRLRMCRQYPAKKLNHPAVLHKSCSYRVVGKSFKDYLK